MVTYICSRCNYITNYKTKFRRHLNRKYPCQTMFSKEGILDIKQKYGIIDKMSVECKYNVSTMSVQKSPNLKNSVSTMSVQNTPNVSTMSVQNTPNVSTMSVQCQYCNKQFKHRQSKFNHEKKFCKVKKEKNIIKHQESKIHELEKALVQAKSVTNNTTNNITNNTNNTLNQIVINNFGKENLDYITYKDIKKHLGYGPYGAIRRLIKMVHYDKKHPENHNIAITNKKSKYGSIKKDNVWQLISIKDMLNNLIETKFEMITEAYYGDIKDKVDGFKQKKYERFFEEFEYDEEKVRKYLDTKIHLMLMNCTKLFNIKPK